MLRHSCAPKIGHADPCTRALPPQRAGDGPGPEASVRPKRSARAKPVSYVAEQQAGQHVEALKAAARLFLSDAEDNKRQEPPRTAFFGWAGVCKCCGLRLVLQSAIITATSAP